MILTIDSGNTRTKWAVFDPYNAVAARGVINNRDLGAVPSEWTECALAVISNVAGAAVAEQLRGMLGTIRQHWLTADAEAYGIVNAYDKPARLGPDRWAAMVGARGYTKQHCLVVNAGTALTVDALLQDDASGVCRFAGGIIVPGLHAMQQALLCSTHDVKLALETSGQFSVLPTNTVDAVYSGALMAMAGAVEHMSRCLQRMTDSSVHCMLSGGDASLLMEQLKGSASISDIVLVEDLVLRGLLLIGREVR